MASQQTYDRYRQAARYPLFLAALLFLIGLILLIEPESFEGHPLRGRYFTVVAWAIYLADYVISLVLAPKRVEFVKTHILQGIGVFFPPLRILLIMHVTTQIAVESRARFGKRVREYLLYLTTLVVVVASIAVTAVEHKAPGATILTFGDALWWSATTISTVGYGDMYPVTLPGRFVAVALMVNGFLILSVLTATIAQTFTDRQSTPTAEEERELNNIEPA